MNGKLIDVLLIDDDSDDNFIHSRILKRSGKVNDIFIAEDGKEALEFLEKRVESHQRIPDLILLDINMPVMNGWEFLEILEEMDFSNNISFIVVMLTTSANPDDKSRAQSMRLSSGYYNKPISTQDLDTIIAQHIY